MSNFFKRFILTAFFIASHTITAGFDFMSPDNLYKTELVRKELINIGAQEITINTADNVPLAALHLKRKNANATMIVIPGFLGIKESYAAFVQHFPQYNILLIDQRGRGQSGGIRWWKSVLSYGTNDYLDIIGAIQYINANDKLPIIIYGSCAGAFNAGRALIQLQKEQLIKKYNIKALIFESGWHSVSNAGISAALGDISSNILYYIGPNAGTAVTTPRKALDLRRPTKLFNIPYQLCKEALHLLCWAVGDQIGQLDEKLDIFQDLRLVSIPMFFIHAEDDHYIPIQSAYLLSRTIKNAHCWWIGPGASWHVRHHCYLGKEFETRINNFCYKALSS